MEDLTKTQIILLALLVSFVTSIATGIITTSLLAEAPTSVTQTINRVVENTIEKVITPAPGGSTSVTKEVTIIKEDDAISKAIEKISSSVVRISVRGPGGDLGFYALGVIVSNNGLVLTYKNNLVFNAPYSVLLSDGVTLNASIAYQSDTDNLVLFQIEPDASHKGKFSAASLSPNTLRLGQTIVLVSGREKNSVHVARVTSLNTRTEKDTKGQNITGVYSAETDLSSSVEVSGAPIVNLSGELVGLKSLSNDQASSIGVYTAILPIKQLIEKAQ